MTDSILLVDREANRSRLLQKRLERHGFAVTSVGSLDEMPPLSDRAARILLVDLGLFYGPERGRLEELVSRAVGARTYACGTCGRRLFEAVSGHGELLCCGRPMELATPGHTSED